MDKVLFCTKCGHELTEGALFCAYCGTRISANTDLIAASAQYEHFTGGITDTSVEEKAKWEGNIPPKTGNPVKPIRPDLKQITCYKCGETIPEYSQFCPVCQTQLFLTCPNCGLRYSSKYPSCPECGTNYRDALLIKQREKEECEKKYEKEYLDFLKFLDDCNLVIVKGGSFLMGATPEQGPVKKNSNRNPVHSVMVDTFIISKFLVTQELWLAVMGYNPSHFINDQNPVESITFEELCDFINAAQQRYKMPFRLPTEAEWEYAARGGILSHEFKYPGGNDITELGWVKTNSDRHPHPVGLKKPNELGLYDMAGNVWEIVEDIYDSKFYSRSPQINPCNSKIRSNFSAWWLDSYGNHVMRGGSFGCGAEDATSSYRGEHVENSMFGKYQDVGFRLALDYPSENFPERD